jgi:hypothetical protein
MVDRSDRSRSLAQMKTYYDLDGNQLDSPEGQADYVVREADGDLEIATHYMEGEPVLVVYTGSTVDGATAYHRANSLECAFQVDVDGATWVFGVDGAFSYKTRHLTVSADLLLEEELDAKDQLLGGTAYLMDDGVIRYAVEFDAHRKLGSCFDFKKGTEVPLETVGERLEMM